MAIPPWSGVGRESAGPFFCAAERESDRRAAATLARLQRPTGSEPMSSQDPVQALLKAARELSDEEFQRLLERGRPTADELVSIEDLAAELNRSVRTLRRWSTRADAPKRLRRGRRLLYRRSDIQHWFEQRARRPGANQAEGESN